MTEVVGTGSDQPVVNAEPPVYIRPPPDLRHAVALFAALIVMVALGDFLIWPDKPGLSVALLVASLLSAAEISSARKMSLRKNALLCLGALAIVLPLVEFVQPLSLAIAAIGMVWFAAALGPSHENLPLRTRIRMFLISAPLFAVHDIPSSLRGLGTFSDARGQIVRLALLVGLPVIVLIVFGTLLVSANPLIQSWLTSFSGPSWNLSVNPARIGLWLVLVVLVWPFIALPRVFMRPAGFNASAEAKVDLAVEKTLPRLINAGSVILSLSLLNVMFAVQSLLDLIYLWGGVELPEGLTYAEYAHRGAYPLIFTALLAGGFALISRPFAAVRPVLRLLLTLWLAQNVLLVVSSLLRLELYIDAFGLTYLRVYAAIWMMLVAIGLVMTLVQLWRGYSNGWLVGMTAAIIAGTLYGASFVNFADGIARYNIARFRSDPTTEFDLLYLCSLGPMAAAAFADAPEIAGSCDSFLTEPTAATWRSWSYRQGRINRELLERRHQSF